MTSLIWIVVGGLLMSAVAMVGSAGLLLRRATLQRLLLPLVAFAAGTLLGGAFFHMIPGAGASLESLDAAVWLVAGFAAFLAIEQFLHWHHSHRGDDRRAPVTYLILVGDAAHNFFGGVAVASTFLIDPRAGMVAWLAAAAHEIPQELGDFGVLVHGGWPRRKALLWNFLSALGFPVGALLAWAVAQRIDVAALVLFGAGNFLYIAASDLIPEIKAQPRLRTAALHFACVFAGLALMFALARWFHAA